MKWIALCNALLLSSALLMAAESPVSAAQAGDDYDVIFADSPQAERAQQGVVIALERHLSTTIAAGALGTILVKDGSEEWQQSHVPTSVLITAIHFVDGQTVWASGHDGVLLQSTDGGVSWTRKMDGYELLEMEQVWLERREAELTELMESTDDEELAFEYEYLLDELVFQIQAAEIQQDVGPTKPFLDVFFRTAEHGFAIGAYGLMLETQDAGESWDVVTERLENPTGFHLNQMISNQDGELFIIGEAGQLFRSADHGQQWELLDSPYHGSFFGGLFDQQGRFWVYGLRGNVFVSSDNGDTFTSVDSGTRYNLNSGTVLADGTIALVGHSGTLVFFDPQSLQAERFNHSSNTPLSGVLQDAGNQMTLVGRGGLMQFVVPTLATR